MTPSRIRLLGLVLTAMTLGVLLNMFALQHPQGPSISQVNPLPAKPEPGSSAKPAETRKALASAVQRELARKGYLEATDGLDGLESGAAILAYEYDHGLPLSATASEALLEALVLGRPLASGAGRASVTKRAAQIIRTVQNSLTGLGYPSGAIDGRVGPRTRAAIKAFERDSHLRVSGRISAPLIRALGKAAAVKRISLAREQATRR